MHHETFELKDTSGGPLFAQRWRPRTESRAAVGIVHGLGEHSGRHSSLAQSLVRAGFEVLAFDLRGHGRSPGRRGHVSDYQHLMNDLGLMENLLAEQNPELPGYFLGQSLGGSLVLNFGLRRETSLQGFVVSSPLIHLTERPALPARLAVRSLSALWPTFHLKTGIQTGDLAPDTEVEQAYRDDELVHGRVTARMAVAVVDAGAWALKHAAKLAIPTLLLHGDQDRVTSFSASQQFANACPEFCEFVAVSGGRHEVLQGESGKPRVQRIIQWLLEQSD